MARSVRRAAARAISRPPSASLWSRTDGVRCSHAPPISFRSSRSHVASLPSRPPSRDQRDVEGLRFWRQAWRRFARTPGGPGRPADRDRCRKGAAAHASNHAPVRESGDALRKLNPSAVSLPNREFRPRPDTWSANRRRRAAGTYGCRPRSAAIARDRGTVRRWEKADAGTGSETSMGDCGSRWHSGVRNPLRLESRLARSRCQGRRFHGSRRRRELRCSAPVE
jgi:hypothetical protein